MRATTVAYVSLSVDLNLGCRRKNPPENMSYAPLLSLLKDDGKARTVFGWIVKHNVRMWYGVGA